MTAAMITLPREESKTQAADSNWNRLYNFGAVAALLSVIFFPIQIVVCFMSPPPDTVLGWFRLFQDNRLIGLLDLDLLLMVDQVLAILIFLALYVTLRRVNVSLMAIAIAFGLVSAVLFIASNPAFAMLSLSDQYVAAGTVAQQAMFLAAGQAMLVTWQGSAFQASYLLGSLASIIISMVMLQDRGRTFGKSTAFIGILANTIALGLYVPKVGTYISIFSVVLLWLWYILLARRFFQLGHGVLSETADQS